MRTKWIRLHAIATWPKRVESQACVVVPRDQENADDFLDRMQFRFQQLFDCYATEGLFDKPPSKIVGFVEICGFNGTYEKATKAELHAMLTRHLPWDQLQYKGKAAEHVATAAGVVQALFLDERVGGG